MNILMVTQLFPLDDAAETNASLREFVDDWIQDGHCVEVLRPVFSFQKSSGKLPERMEYENGLIVHTHKPKRIPYLKIAPVNHRKIAEKLKHKPDVVVMHIHNAYLSYYRIAARFKVPLIIGIHKADIMICRSWIHRPLLKSIYKQAAGIAIRSAPLMKMFTSCFPQFQAKTFLAMSGIPAYFLDEAQKILSDEHISQRNFADPVRIVSVGALIKRKQFNMVLKALAQLSDEYPFQYTIIGEGYERANLEREISEHGLKGKVILPGRISRGEVFEELQQSDIFIMPSTRETLGLVYLEAMACGNIVIGSRGWGIDGIIKSGENGFLCNPDSQKSVNETLQMAISMNQTEVGAMRKSSLDTVLSFNRRKMSKQYLDKIIQMTKAK